MYVKRVFFQFSFNFTNTISSVAYMIIGVNMFFTPLTFVSACYMYAKLVQTW